jgi:hypothetical protein
MGLDMTLEKTDNSCSISYSSMQYMRLEMLKTLQRLRLLQNEKAKSILKKYIGNKSMPDYDAIIYAESRGYDPFLDGALNFTFHEDNEGEHDVDDIKEIVRFFRAIDNPKKFDKESYEKFQEIKNLYEEALREESKIIYT